jgi:ribonucleoside-diphosphate reductase beta chain
VELAPYKKMKTVLNTVNTDSLKQPIFLGEDLAIQRYDRLKYPKFYDLYDQQMNFFWRPQEVNLTKDSADYKNLSPEERFVFDSNLRFQTMTDSMLSRSINSLADYVSNPELEICMNVWSFFETIHSNSYTYILQNVHPDATKFFDSILEDKEIVKRAEAISSRYDALLNTKSEDPKQQIFDALLATQITEGLTFYVSFACSFYFGYRGKMEGNAKIINLISRDENLHVAITQNIFKILRDNPKEGFQEIVKKNEDRVYEAYRMAVDAEKEWADYLFSRGNLIGLTSDSLKNYVEWLADSRLTSMGYKKIYNVKSNPLSGWLDSFYDSKKIQVAPQETEISSYVKGVDNKMDESVFQMNL